MNIDFKVTDILPDRWWNLTRDVLSDKKFDKEEFETLFKETFEVLRHCVCEDCVNKELIELIKNVSGFVATRFAKVNYWHLAACELTDAMLTNCLQGETQKKPMTKGKWVLLTTEIGVDFMNVDEMLFNFSEDLAWASFSPEDFADDCCEKDILFHFFNSLKNIGCYDLRRIL